jgi:prepilin-type N-terminal cleavage/methylation domain-containing protein
MKTREHVVIRRVWESFSKRGTHNGFTLVELLVVVTIIVILASLLAPMLGLALQHAYKVRCMAHLGNLAKCHLAYTTDNGQFLPGDDGGVIEDDIDWTNEPWGAAASLSIQTGLLYKGGYLRDTKIWLCPAVTLKSPGEYYIKYPMASFKPNPPWTQALIDTHPYTYHYSYNARTFLSRPCDDGGNAPSTAPWYGYAPWYKRRIDSFTDLDKAVLLAEENTGKVPWDGGYMSAGMGVLNDTWFVDPDVTENRHLNCSAVNYLDGHSGVLPPAINLTTNSKYLCAPAGSH